MTNPSLSPTPLRTPPEPPCRRRCEVWDLGQDKYQWDLAEFQTNAASAWERAVGGGASIALRPDTAARPPLRSVLSQAAHRAALGRTHWAREGI